MRFFVELSPRLDTAKVLERDLDRHLARRFNVSDYLNTSEAGLSRIIADLLNPAGPHGQGTIFLATLLEGLAEIRHRPKLGTAFTKRIGVVTERTITNNRRLDISVEIPDGDRAFCLAIENKPYADDQPNQVKDYLGYLEQEYSNRFLLLYLSPTSDGPDESSIPQDELQRWHERFAIMAYRADAASVDSEGSSGDVFDDFRVELSLANWFAACRQRCDPERLRYFLRDAETYCRNFGGHSMPTDSETRAMQDYLFSNPNQLPTAQAVYDAWPAIKARLCERFLEHLRTMIHKRVEEELGGSGSDLQTETKYGGEKGWANFLWIYRGSWRPWENRRTTHPPYEGCTAVVMQSAGPGPNGWRWGVLHPLAKSSIATRAEKERRERLEENLRTGLVAGRSDSWWPYLGRVSDEKASWNALLPDLYRELENGGGPITDYYVDGMTDLATTAIPIIDEVERAFGK